MRKYLPICISCNIPLSLWGTTVSGRKRYRCHNCGKTRLYSSHKRKPDLSSLFRQYVLWGFTYNILSSVSGYSIRYLESYIQEKLTTDPPILSPLDQSRMEEAYLLIDGLWFGRWFVLMVYRQSKNLTILHISVAGNEGKRKIAKDLKYLVHLGYHFTGLVSDGGKGIVSAIEEVFPHSPHQVCLAHMHRDVVNSIGRYSKDERVRKLKQIADHVWLIESREALSWWKKQVKDWVEINYSFLVDYRTDTQGKWWYIHKGARKAVRILLKLPRISFTFLSHHLMPKTTNEIEAQFGHLEDRWLTHRGLKRERWENLMKWFVYFYNQEKLSESKRKKD